jgi:hypothetical protein
MGLFTLVWGVGWLDGLGFGLWGLGLSTLRYNFVLGFSLRTFGLGGSVFIICAFVTVMVGFDFQCNGSSTLLVDARRIVEH